MEELLKKARLALGQGKPQECLNILQAFLDKDENAPISTINRAKALDLSAQARWGAGLKDLALLDWQEATHILQSLQDGGSLALEAGILCNLSHAFLESNKHDKAIEAALEALNAGRKLEHKEAGVLAFALFTLSAPYYRQKDYLKAQEYILKAKEIWEKSGNMEKAATCMNNLGRIHEELGNVEEGIFWHKKAVEQRRLLPCKEDLAFSLGNLGVALSAGGRWREAEKALAEAVELYIALDLQNSHECQMCAANLDIARKALEDGLDDLMRTGKNG